MKNENDVRMEKEADDKEMERIILFEKIRTHDIHKLKTIDELLKEET